MVGFVVNYVWSRDDVVSVRSLSMRATFMRIASDPRRLVYRLGRIYLDNLPAQRCR